MHLNDKLQICLLAIASRFPDHVLDINEAVLGTQRFGPDGWTAPDLIEMFRHTAPSVLQTNARLIINSQKSEIYLLSSAEEQPAIFVHCRGKMPDHQGNIEARLKVHVTANATR